MGTEQVLFFLTATIIMTGAGLAFLLPSILRGRSDNTLRNIFLAFGAKMFTGMGVLVVSLKVFEWSITVTAIGTVVSYMVALTAVTLISLKSIKRGNG